MPFSERTTNIVSLLRCLLTGTTVVIAPEDVGWVVQARERDYAAGASTREKAIHGFKMGYLADVLLHVFPDVDQGKSCPDDVWAELTSRPDAAVQTLRVSLTAETPDTGHSPPGQTG